MQFRLLLFSLCLSFVSYASRRVKNYSTRVWLTVTENIFISLKEKLGFIHYILFFVCLAQHSGDHIVPGIWTCAPVVRSILSAYWAISPAHSLCSYYWAASTNGTTGFSFWFELGWGRKLGKMPPSGHCVEDSVEGGDRQCQYCQCYPVEMWLLPLISLLLPFATSSAVQSSPQSAPGQQSFFLACCFAQDFSEFGLLSTDIFEKSGLSS